MLSELVDVSHAVANTPARGKKIDELASFLQRLGPGDLAVSVTYLAGEIPQGTIGVGWAALRDLPPPSPSPSLSISEVDAALGRVALARGQGSRALRRSELGMLFARATSAEQRFLVELLSGGLRQGALQGVMTDAVARAVGLPLAQVRRALMLSGDLGEVAEAGLSGGGLEHFRMRLMSPVLPMLAQSAPTVSAALDRIRPAAVEWKLDGARMQVHRQGQEVRAFTRNLADVTDRVPEVTEAIRALPIEAGVFDGEVIALDADGRPLPFQVTMGRFGSRLDVDRLRGSVPLSLLLFDCLHLDGEDLLDRPASHRFDALVGRVPERLVVPRQVVGSNGDGEAVLEQALERGHEGVVVKSLDAPYEAGRRGAGWLKVKRAHTLDLVVLAAEWGHGRRRGWLSNLHLGARDTGSNGFVMLGKTFKGMTDEMLSWQTERLLELETHKEGITVHVRPELVVEVAFDGLQSSSRYPGGLALRFARVKGYRTDKRPAEADTMTTVRALATSR